MTFLHAFFLGALQGITEFLPVSSSAHLSISHILLDIPYSGKVFDTFLNIGSLLAILISFKSQTISLILGFKDFLINEKSKDKDFFITILLSSLPTIMVFGIAETVFDIDINSLVISSTALIVFGIVLYLCDRSPTNKSKISKNDSLWIGIAQTMSLIPGVSRLGACLSMSRYLNYSREESFRYSIILSIPSVAGACFLRSVKIFRGEVNIENWSMVVVGAISAFIFGMISLHVVEKFMQKHTLLPIIVYRILFGIFVLIYSLFISV